MRLWKKPESIVVDADTFTVRGIDPPREPIALDDIQEVTFFKRDEWATDLICCDIVVRSEREWFRKVAFPAFAANSTTVFKRLE